jgi:hypothetical protein
MIGCIWFNGHDIEDHFVGVDEMIKIGRDVKQPIEFVLMSRYTCYLGLQTADLQKVISTRVNKYSHLVKTTRTATTCILQ